MNEGSILSGVRPGEQIDRIPLDKKRGTVYIINDNDFHFL